jgi:hypothetical protein
MGETITILKEPLLPKSANYEWLRKKGLEYIEQLGSSLWTDYNIHDPGITILELLCYAITDLGYRTSLDIKDLLADPENKMPKENPERQGFYTARKILTVNPWTTSDFRKLLVDIIGIKNGWLTCKACPCNDLWLFANCSTSSLQYKPTEHPVNIKGLYDVLIEFETEAGTGDLNSGKIKYNHIFDGAEGLSSALLELRMPTWQQLQDHITLFEKFCRPGSIITAVEVPFISGNKKDNVDFPEDRKHIELRGLVYPRFVVHYRPDKEAPLEESIVFEDIPLKIWFNKDADRRAIDIAGLKTAMANPSSSGIIGKYHQLIQRAGEVIRQTKTVLHQHRNLAEDYCKVTAVAVEDIAVCTDMDVSPDAEIETVLAEAYYRIDQYLGPDIRFYSLKELMDAGKAVEDIFEGPALNNGFIDNEQLESTHLKTHIYASDIINLLMDIPGVMAIRNFTLTKYNAEGFQVDNQPWVMPVSFQHQPRLYLEASKVLVFKNRLPFLPDLNELNDSIQVLKGLYGQPQFSILENDLPVPQGKYFDLSSYQSLQHSLPLTYGVGAYGLPSTASRERKALAMQLKGYLMVFEQILANYLYQLKNLKEVFAIDQHIAKTYFSGLLKEEHISHVDDLYNGLNEISLQGITENETTFLNRRNRFLDHLMARFAENFNAYALMLYSYSTSKKLADIKLIHDKINFLKDLPFMSANRAKAFNYKNSDGVCTPHNISGLEVRIRRLLGMEDAVDYFELYDENDEDGVQHELRWRLKDVDGALMLSSSTRYFGETYEGSERKLDDEIREVMRFVATEARYDVKKVKTWVVNLTDETGEVIATKKYPFKTKAEALKAKDELVAFGKMLLAGNKIFVVEHLLLRPRNKPTLPLFPEGDPLLSICIPDDCSLCGEEDPYSFRLTIVLSGETGIANSGIEFRRFAEETIRGEIPAHLGLKICWVSNEQLLRFEEVYCAWLHELSLENPDAFLQHEKLKALLKEFESLKSVYPEARLHDCKDGDDSNRVFLGQTIISSRKNEK